MVKEKKNQTKKILLLIGVVLLILIGIFRIHLATVFNVLYGVTIDRAINLTTHAKESFNIAVLGIGGARHDGPDLSDTIILANVNIKQNKVRMFSIPRDLWIPSVSNKINEVYAGAKKEDTGIASIENIIQKVTGQEVDYVLVLDFEGFIKLVDHLGGIDVDVANVLDDYNYPIEGMEEENCGKTSDEIDSFIATNSAETELWDYFPCRYKHLHVDQGLIHMGGQKALEFVRSRHGIGTEGSDFARSRRQQLVIKALKDKAFSLGVILNPIKLIGVYNIIRSNIDTNIDIEKIDDFIKLANKLKNGAVENYVIDEKSNIDEFGLLIHPPISSEYRSKWVLIPRMGDGNFSEVQRYVKCIVDGQICTIGKSGIITPSPKL